MSLKKCSKVEKEPGIWIHGNLLCFDRLLLITESLNNTPIFFNRSTRWETSGLEKESDVHL